MSKPSDSRKRSKSPIDGLIKNANKGDFWAQLQLSEYYATGTYVDKDESQASDWLEQALDIFSLQKLRIESLELRQFRGIGHIWLKDLDPNLMVIFGANGAGKTSILDVIAKAMSWLINRIAKNGGSGDGIDETDIKLDCDYGRILAQFRLNKQIKIPLLLEKSKDGVLPIRKNEVMSVTRVGQVYKVANTNVVDYNLPLMAYYTVSRSLDVNQKDISQADEIQAVAALNKFDGYSGALNGKADFRAFFRWFKRIDDIDKHRKLTTDTSMTLDFGFINTLKQMAKSDANAAKLLANLGNNADGQSAQTLDGDAVDIDKIKRLVNKVISYFMPGFGDLQVQVEPTLALLISKNEQSLNVLQLSQGEKSLLALMLDIARRLILLNPSLPDPLNGAGIVLIDEFDLHVHPQWQRNIIRGLPKLFPNCQFIVTTHSPQILGEVKPHQLLKLTQDQHNEIALSRPQQSYGLTSNEILNELMVTDSGQQVLMRTQEVEQQLSELHQLIANKDFDNALAQIQLMEKELNGEIPELVAAKFDIDVAGWDE